MRISIYSVAKTFCHKLCAFFNQLLPRNLKRTQKLQSFYQPLKSAQVIVGDAHHYPSLVFVRSSMHAQYDTVCVFNLPHSLCLTLVPPHLFLCAGKSPESAQRGRRDASESSLGSEDCPPVWVLHAGKNIFIRKALQKMSEHIFCQYI